MLGDDTENRIAAGYKEAASYFDKVVHGEITGDRRIRLTALGIRLVCGLQILLFSVSLLFGFVALADGENRFESVFASAVGIGSTLFALIGVVKKNESCTRMFFVFQMWVLSLHTTYLYSAISLGHEQQVRCTPTVADYGTSDVNSCKDKLSISRSKVFMGVFGGILCVVSCVLSLDFNDALNDVLAQNDEGGNSKANRKRRAKILATNAQQSATWNERRRHMSRDTQERRRMSSATAPISEPTLHASGAQQPKEKCVKFPEETDPPAKVERETSSIMRAPSEPSQMRDKRVSMLEPGARSALPTRNICAEPSSSSTHTDTEPKEDTPPEAKPEPVPEEASPSEHRSGSPTTEACTPAAKDAVGGESIKASPGHQSPDPVVGEDADSGDSAAEYLPPARRRRMNKEAVDESSATNAPAGEDEFEERLDSEEMSRVSELLKSTPSTPPPHPLRRGGSAEEF